MLRRPQQAGSALAEKEIGMQTPQTETPLPVLTNCPVTDDAPETGDVSKAPETLPEDEEDFPLWLHSGG